ncbi:DUF4339 domain-containing protein [Verrucomicrobiaceae bacterium 227]
MTPDAQWYYADANGGQQGPFLLAQLQQMAASGQIQPATMLWTEGLADWVQAVQVEGIYAAAPAPAPVAPANPYVAPGASPIQQGNMDYPVPTVKKTSFGLYIGALLFPVLLGLIAILLVFATSKPESIESSPRSEKNQQHADAGTPEEIRLADEQLQDTSPQELSKAEIGGSIAVMALIVLALISMLFAGIYAYIILYRAWYCLQPGGARTTPGAAVGFLFVPIYSLYWIFVAFGGWAKDWNRIRASYPNLRNTPVVSEGLFMTGVISMVTIIGAPIAMICFIMMHKQMCDAINSMVSLRSAAAMGKPGSLPSFY